jgi:uncharacterized protein
MNRSQRRRRIVTAAVAASSAVLVLAACGGRVDQSAPAGESGEGCEARAGQLTIATGNSTGVYYVLGGGIASLLSAETPLRVTAAETGASVQNIEQLVAGDYDIAFSLADTAVDAIEGDGAFSAPQEVSALGRIHSNPTQVIVRADSGIERVEDMAGRRISTGSPKSGTEVIATRLLDAAGLDIETDIAAQRLDMTKTVDAMKDGTIDGMFWSGGLPTPGVTDLFTSAGDSVEFIDITPLLGDLQEVNPVYAESTIPADVYGTDDDVPTIIVPNVLLVRDDMDDATACAITTTIWSGVEQLETVHSAAAALSPEVALETDPIPIHPGAQRALEDLEEG